MTSNADNPNEFSDPELRTALRRACPQTPAPLSLRFRVRQMMDQPEAAPLLQPPPTTSPAFWRSGQWLASGRHMAAAAAVIGLVLGMGLYLLTTDTNAPANPTNSSLASTDSMPLAVRNALAGHDELDDALASGDAQARSSLFTAPQLRDQLQQQRSITLPAVDLSSMGWKFVAGKTYPPESSCLAQLFFTRDHQTLSVFVLDDQALRPGTRFATRKGHLIALRKINNGTLGVIGYCPAGRLSQAEVDKIASLFAEQ